MLGLDRVVKQYGAPAQDPLATQRDAMFGALDKQRGLYEDPFARELEYQLRSQLLGENQPFSPGVVDSIASADADSSAASFAAERDLIRQAMANAGLSGSGGQLQAETNAMNRANSATRAARRDIQTRADLENFQARERAQQNLNAYLAQRAQAKQAANLMEAQLRSQFEQVTDQAPTTGGPSTYIPWRDGNAAGPNGAGVGSQAMSYAPSGTIITSPMGTGRGNVMPGGGGGYNLGAGSGGHMAQYMGGNGAPFAVAPNVVNAPGTYGRSFGNAPANQTRTTPTSATPTNPQHTVNAAATGALSSTQGWGAAAMQQQQQQNQQQLMALQAASGLFGA